MKLSLKEPLQARYLYVSPDNVVHVLMPVVSGTNIGLDNTCRAAYSLCAFFGKVSESNQKDTLKCELLAYKEALESDLILLGAGALLGTPKKERLTQIDALLEIVMLLEKHPELNCLNDVYPRYPRPLEAIMQDRATSNLYSMVLRPTTESGFLRSEAANPIFSVAHKNVAKNRYTTVSPLQQALISAYRPLRYASKDLKARVIQQVLTLTRTPHAPVDFPRLRDILTNAVKDLLNESVDFTQTQQRTPLTEQAINTALGLNALTATPQEYIEALLGYCAPNLFDNKAESPFNALTDAEDWSIATQFLLGIANIHGVFQGNVDSNTNFGQILDDNEKSSQEIAQTLAQAQKTNQCIEDAALSWLNVHAEQLQLKKSFDSNDVTSIKKSFAMLYAEIKDSPHFDEFFILNTQKKGTFFTHQGSICTSFAEFACSPYFDLPQKLIDSLAKARNNASTLTTEIPHQNPLVQGEVNTTTMDNTQLQALHKRIITHKDAILKKQLLTQLKQEHPYFKPPIDAKQFLLHVAYGNQIEAEALLQKDLEFAQELLKACNIPFTDYSGRTFTCSAYEYAYWAKDTHMQRMLEKYILQNEETRQLILRYVQDIEKLVSVPGFFGLFKKSNPRGLHYTTQDKEGKTIHHCEAHFDLAPLKKALEHCLEEHDRIEQMHSFRPNWGTVDKILREEVGRAQRDVPAHIAQEYCQLNRSFMDVIYNDALLDAQKPANLKRTLKFYHEDTSRDKLWFCPDSYAIDSGQGFSFGIMEGGGVKLRGGYRGAYGHSDGRRAANACGVDLKALELIDKARTKDLRQSLSNLSQPPTAQSSRSHSTFW